MKMKPVILFAADEPLEDMHVIDWHAHAAGLGYGGSGAFINEQLRNNFRFRFFLQMFEAYPNLYADISSLTQVSRPGGATRTPDSAPYEPALPGRRP